MFNNHKHFDPNLANSTNFYPPKVVDRGSEAQLQVGTNLNLSSQSCARFKRRIHKQNN